MSRLTDLLRQLRSADPQLGADLEKEITALAKRRSFGLVFERHQPEAVELPDQPISRAAKVRVLAPRGVTTKGDQRLWRVESLDIENGNQIARLIENSSDDPDHTTAPVEDLVLVAEFDDKIYPGLVETGRVENGSDKPFHTVINAENFHALELLTYTHRGMIDAIYIDPPYNTGARDWKYNNDYVEGDDDYRHSKWLAFMERRLLVARELLNPDDSVLIVTIDEKEYLRLGLMLEQTFPEARVQMVSSLTNPKGVARGKEFYRVDEYLFFVYFGAAGVQKTSDPMILTGKRESETDDEDATVKNVRWGNLLRSGTDARRVDRRHQFYPIFLDKLTGTLHSVGNALLPVSAKRDLVEAPDGTLAVWPIRKDGSEGRWMVGSDTVRGLFSRGYASIGRFNGTDRVSFSYVTENVLRQIESGSVVISGRFDHGVVSLEFTEDVDIFDNPKTMWNKKSHSASEYGTTLLRDILPGRKFPYPKSLYAVEDALRFFVADKPEAVVLDFFSGSGTTAHAVMRLNHRDDGRRQCISVTNNEVSADEQSKLSRQGLRAGDTEWERWGICDYITKPRIRAAITGKTPEGEPIRGDYKFTDDFPMTNGFDENAAFFTLTYEAPLSVRHNRAFERIAPMLWMRAGSTGRIIDDLGDRGWDVSDVYAVLENIDSADGFFNEIGQVLAVRTVFVVTDDDAAFQMVCRELPSTLSVVQLYESYLQNFEITQGRGF